MLTYRAVREQSSVRSTFFQKIIVESFFIKILDQESSLRFLFLRATHLLESIERRFRFESFSSPTRSACRKNGRITEVITYPFYLLLLHSLFYYPPFPSRTRSSIDHAGYSFRSLTCAIFLRPTWNKLSSIIEIFAVYIVYVSRKCKAVLDETELVARSFLGSLAYLVMRIRRFESIRSSNGYRASNGVKEAGLSILQPCLASDKRGGKAKMRHEVSWDPITDLLRATLDVAERKLIGPFTNPGLIYHDDLWRVCSQTLIILIPFTS